ncbi:MAG: hypothetical protein ACYTKD_07640 [Planctomycetota bacterium]
MAEPSESRSKVQSIFSELAGGRAEQLEGSRFPARAAEAVERALSADLGEDTAHDIGFHLADWSSDAAFLVALCLFPDRFSDKEIEDGVMGFMHHVPHHVAAAAKLYGEPVRDVFGVGPLEAPLEDAQAPDGPDAARPDGGEGRETE